MPANFENKYLQSLFDNLTASYETETNYTPIEVTLEPQHIKEEDIDILLQFVQEKRKRLFLFKLPNDEINSNILILSARRAFLDQTATDLLNTTTEPKINTLKEALNSASSTVRANIQIQKSIHLPRHSVVAVQRPQSEHIKQLEISNLVYVPIDLPELPNLVKQLSALGIQALQETAAQKIKEYSHAFTDGIIPRNLVKGFYIDSEQHALCYTDMPHRLPSALAPTLEIPTQLKLPSLGEALKVSPNLSDIILRHLLDTSDPLAQKEGLIHASPTSAKEISALLNACNPADAEFIVPMLAKLFILGGETHTRLFIKLLRNCLNKNLSIAFLKDPVAQDAFLSPRGIKNLQKLLKLPAEQKEWWNTLAIAHLKHEKHHFDFNNFFEAYTQIFLPRIADKNLTLPNPCPINHEGHLLVTLNRVLDVLEHAQNPQEQCLALEDLDWGPTGVHYAMIQAPTSERFLQVAACMHLEKAEDVKFNLETIYNHLNGDPEKLNMLLFRYLGQHWKSRIRLTDIEAQFVEIQNQATWSAEQKNQLLFILTCTFANEENLTAEHWQKMLKNSINLLQPLSHEERADLLQGLSRCFKFKPIPSFLQIQGLLLRLLELKTSFPDKNFKNELIAPYISCLENEGFELIDTLQERMEKTNSSPENNLSVVASFAVLLQNNRQNLTLDAIKLLARIDEPDLSQNDIDELMLAINKLEMNKGSVYSDVLLSLLSKINVSKSQPLPKRQQIQALINSIIESIYLPEESTLEKQEEWLKNSIIERNLLPGCVFGNGDISKLDDLIVDALITAVKKRNDVLQIKSLKASLQENLQSKLVPDQLKEQLNQELFPLFDALADLVELLQTPNPCFEEILNKFGYFEEKMPKLLNSTYSLRGLGETKGEYILSFILTGQRLATDNQTGRIFSGILTQLHGLINREIHAYFNDERNKNKVTDLDANTCLEWLAKFNDTHSLTFLFKEELVQKKVLPALKKTLQQLNTQDPDFENSILEAAGNLAEDQPADQSLQNYKTTIETIVSYLNFLIDVKDKASDQFYTIYKQLQTPPLSRLNYRQKQVLVNTLLRADPASLNLYLKLTTQAFEENPLADTAAIDRALNGLEALFELADLEAETQTLFFKMSVAHNLKNPTPFPLATLNELKKSHIEEETKSLILKQIIQILSRMTVNDSQDLVQDLVHRTQSFLSENPVHASLCIALLKRISLDNLSRDLSTYANILTQLASMNEENREKLIAILTGFANSKKDDTVNLPILLDISKGLGRRSAIDLDQVKQLFATPPYPIAHTLNSALLAHGSEKLQAYCSSFDTNPFAKTGETRPLSEHFTTERIQEALLSLEDLLHEVKLPPLLQLKLAKQLTYIETLGYTDPLKPYDYSELKKLTSSSRQQLKERATLLLNQLRSHQVPEEQLDLIQMELLAHLREIYFRTTGLFPNTTQMLMLLLSLHTPYTNLLMRINTGEGKSLIAPILAVLQWAQGGTVDVCTANRTLLIRDYENSCEPFFKFLEIKSSLIQSDSQPKDYQLNGINCSTLEDMALFRLAAKEAKQEAFIQNEHAIHLVLDESDDALLDQITLYKLVAENPSSEAKDIHAQWIYPLAYQFINLPTFRNTDSAKGKVWDEDEDVEQFRLYINKTINEKFNGDADKQNFMLATSNTQLRQWINASCKAAKLVENKHFIVRPLKEKDETGNEVTKKMVCIPLVRSTPKTGCIFTDGVQQALQARLKTENNAQTHYFFIDADPQVLASQSARGLVRFYQNTGGRLVGISGTPGDSIELQYLATQLGTQAISVAPYAGDNRKKHPPVFTFSRNETINAIHKAIDAVKRPVKKPRLEFDSDIPIQTLEEREAFILQTKDALEKWSQTQTQPILIVSEDFDDAQAIGKSFEAYKKAGFKIQIVTGKESPEELDRIVKQAGKANTITIGTAMLARGIDINPGTHPEGLFVIQPYTDSERMTIQIAGRAARNGKPGQWLPIYQVPAPTSWFTRFMYFLFPRYRQLQSEKTIKKLQDEIKLQATLDRLYTQAIDRAQQTLMQQVHAWESLLLDLYPNDINLKNDLYQWRQVLLSELSNVQETSISADTLSLSIAQFQNAICKIWENIREEKWIAKAQQIERLTALQRLKLNYLKQLDLARELTIQDALQEKSPSFTTAATALTYQNLEAVILDKAGAALEFTQPEEDAKKQLELAQSQQLLPHLIGELCAVYPEAIKTLNTDERSRSSSFFPTLLVSLAEKVIQQKNKVLRQEDTTQITQSTVAFYQNKLSQASAAAIQELLVKIKPLLLAHTQTLASMPLIDKFKMQGLVLTFTKLYRQAGLELDEQLIALSIQYGDEIMKMLAHHLMNEFAWVNQNPQPLHALLERTVAKEAASKIYQVAEELRQAPQDKAKIQALYMVLQEQRVKLNDEYLFSLTHKNPRSVINTALTAIESLIFAPHCDQEFQESCNDSVLSTYHLGQFRTQLDDISQQFNGDTVWNYLKTTLINISEDNNQIYLIEELYETVNRFSSYTAYQPYSNALNTLKHQLSHSIKSLKKVDGFKQDTQDSLFAHKASQFAALFQVSEDQVRIRSGCDGIQSYIEVQIDDSPLREGFTGYQSSTLPMLEKERAQLMLQKEQFDRHREALLHLNDPKACEILPLELQEKFKELWTLKNLLNLDWTTLNRSSVVGLPESILTIHQHIHRLAYWDWTSLPDFDEIEKFSGKTAGDFYGDLPEKHAVLNRYAKEIQLKKSAAEQVIEEKKREIAAEEEKLSKINTQLSLPDCSLKDKLLLNGQLVLIKANISILHTKLSDPVKTLAAITEEERIGQLNQDKLTHTLSLKTKNVIAILQERAQHLLSDYLNEASKRLIATYGQELHTVTTTLGQLEQVESKKSLYQTRRFFSTQELLNYEASVKQEEAMIPTNPAREVRQPTMLTRFFWEPVRQVTTQLEALNLRL
ncbi:helicase-related protein [Legionella jamestowniensis]|uniref:Coiled-coil protein n=1 Tax=Legionella jamestowniensis TaxID=455 RepID=A0A0W0UGC8_9GAMM|nr:helicase-related protein [Legionella jamestowniensis]KTD06929.1 coiled-coil protein [Legionella jamestowniensis]SFL84962.1 Preprotein translocase subunit SecA (ATPase, RNA helicase) [Legionella jamestowniensis DSM 19215]